MCKLGWQHFRSRCLPLTLHDLMESEHRVMAKISELKSVLDALGDKLTKATSEITTEIATLKAALGDAPIPGDAQASLDRLSTLTQALDDLNPDSPTAPPPAPTSAS
jgi:hypothetical protein